MTHLSIGQIPSGPPFSKGGILSYFPPLKKGSWGDFLIIPFLFLLFTACSSGGPVDTSTTQPLVMAAFPNPAPVGGTVTLQGVGFSNIFNENIIVVGNATTQALSHQFIPATALGATEELIFVIPLGAQVGPGSLFTIVDDALSTSIPFTVESP